MTTTDNRWLRWFSIFTAFSTLCLICIGGLVTSHGVGMAVPDWPNSYGYTMFTLPFSHWVGGILYEHSHRLVASFVGLLIAIMAIWLWVRETSGCNRWFGTLVILIATALLGLRNMPVYWMLAALAPIVIVFGFVQARRHPGSLRWIGVVAFAAVILQGVLGGLRVTEMKDEIGIFHGTFAQLLFVLVCALALYQTKFWRTLTVHHVSRFTFHASRLRHFYLAATVLIFAQLVLGATMRHQHAGLAISDFPKAHGKWWPDMSPEAVAAYNQARHDTIDYKPITAFQISLQMTHRILALLILVVVSVSARLTIGELRWQDPLSKISAGLMFLIFGQVLLGIATIWTNKSADIATAHVAVGALSLMTGALLTIISFRLVNVAATRENTADIPSKSTALFPRPAAN